MVGTRGLRGQGAAVWRKMVLGWRGDSMPSRATNEEVVIFCVFGGVEGNEIPVSGGVEGDRNFENQVKRAFFGGWGLVGRRK
jgi:hypothetical protein